MAANDARARAARSNPQWNNLVAFPGKKTAVWEFALKLSLDGPGKYALITVAEVGIERGSAAQAVVATTD